jgi:serine/threonine-protein kinase RsbW
MPHSEQDERPWGHPWEPPTGGATGPPVPGDLCFVLVAEWVAPSIARDRFDRWLRGLSWPSGQREDLVLALNEAVSNSVEHGYLLDADTSQHDMDAEVVEVRAGVLVDGNGARRISLTVCDHGRWREPSAQARFRGHGLSIIRACSDEFNIDGNAAGTTLTLTSRAAPHPPSTT